MVMHMHIKLMNTFGNWFINLHPKQICMLFVKVVFCFDRRVWLNSRPRGGMGTVACVDGRNGILA